MKTYPAKLLLFGEHTVNVGSQALAMPLPLFSGSWGYSSEPEPAVLATKQMHLPQFAEYLLGLKQRGALLLPVDIDAFKNALANGLYFGANIPRGYGVGSSGALVAAVLEEFGHAERQDLMDLKKGLAQMEGFFHGTSSGADPLICFLKKPLLLTKDEIKIVEAPPVVSRLFLLDTGQERQATPLIEYFLKKMKDEGFLARLNQELLPAVDGAIAAFLQNDPELLFDEIHRIGSFQLRSLEKMIPEAFRPLWKEGLESDLFKLKLCGAGGGGFLLGITKDFEELKKRNPNLSIFPITRTEN